MAKRHGGESVNADTLRKFMALRGWEVADLRKASGYSERQIQKMMAGGRAKISTIDNVAAALGVEPRLLFAPYAPPQFKTRRFTISIRMSGAINSVAQMDQLGLFASEMTRKLESSVSYIEATQSSIATELLTSPEQWVVLLLFGKNADSERIYSYLRVPIGKLHSLQDAIESGRSFDPSVFGEVVGTGKGEPGTSERERISRLYDFSHATAPEA